MGRALHADLQQYILLYSTASKEAKRVAVLAVVRICTVALLHMLPFLKGVGEQGVSNVKDLRTVWPTACTPTR